MKKYLFIILTCLTVFSSEVSAFTLSNFEVPESFIVDPDDGSYFVSNINGEPLEKDGNGYISKINSKASLVIQKFIGGRKDRPLLNAPKGLVILGKSIYVTDIDQVKGFNKKTGKLITTIDFKKFGARFLNDIAVDGQGELYVSDMMTNQIFRIKPGKNFEVSVYCEGKALGGPNGLIFNPKSKNLIVVSWDPGRIIEIDQKSRKAHTLKKLLMHLDGVAIDSAGTLYVSSFNEGDIHRIPNYGRGTLTTFMSGLTTPADISFDRRRDEILVPSFKGNTVTTVNAKK